MVSLHAALAVLALSGTGAGQTVLLDFYADWCGPCRAMDSTVQQLAAKGYPVRRVNIDHERPLAAQFRVQSIPCFVMVVDGREVDRVVGGTALGRLEQMCRMGRAANPAGSPSMLAADPFAAKARPGLLGRLGGNGRPAAAPAVAGPIATPSATAAVSGGAVMPASWSPGAPAAAGVTDAALICASVRLRIEDADGHSCGSGTTIDARPGGEALVLTCGHVFRDSQGKGKIEVDVFGPGPSYRVPGRLIAYDLKRDVGLVAFQPQGAVTVAHVAPVGTPIRQGDVVASVGCNNGELPTVQHSRITKLDKYLGPPNIEVAGQPVVGRSGGGLFSADGMVIGVCNAADPSDQDGFYAALGSVHAQLDESGLSSIYQSRPGAANSGNSMLAAAPRVRIPTPATEPTVRGASAETTATVALAPGEQMALEDIRRQVKEGSEVVCIIRNGHDPNAKSQVITLDRASGAFVKQLTGEAQPGDPRRETALEIPRPRTPLLEWDAETGWRHRGSIPQKQ